MECAEVFHTDTGYNMWVTRLAPWPELIPRNNLNGFARAAITWKFHLCCYALQVWACGWGSHGCNPVEYGWWGSSFAVVTCGALHHLCMGWFYVGSFQVCVSNQQW